MAIYTIKPSGGSYTSLSAAQTGVAGDLSSIGQTTFECYKGDYGAGGGVNYIDDNLALAGWSNESATNYLKITTPLSERHDGTPKSGGSNWSGFAIRHDDDVIVNDAHIQYTRIEGLIIVSSYTGLYNGHHGIYSNSDYARINNNIVVSEGSKCDRGIYAKGEPTSSNPVYVFNNLVCSDDNGSSHDWQDGINVFNDVRVWNNTVVNCDEGIVNAGEDTTPDSYPTVENNIVQATTCLVNAATMTSEDYNLISDTSGVGTNTLESTTLAFVDAANGDYMPSAADVTNYISGMSASDPSSALYSTDLRGESHTSWVGAIQYVAASTAPLLLLNSNNSGGF